MGRNNNSDDMWELDKSQINIQESGESVAQNNKGFYISADDFGPLAKYVKDQNITDIDYIIMKIFIETTLMLYYSPFYKSILEMFIR